MKYFYYYSEIVSGERFYFFTCGRDNKISVGCFYVEEGRFEFNVKALEDMGYQNLGGK